MFSLSIFSPYRILSVNENTFKINYLSNAKQMTQIFSCALGNNNKKNFFTKCKFIICSLLCLKLKIQTFFTFTASIPELSVAICYEFFIITNLIFFRIPDDLFLLSVYDAELIFLLRFMYLTLRKGDQMAHRNTFYCF